MHRGQSEITHRREVTVRREKSVWFSSVPPYRIITIINNYILCILQSLIKGFASDDTNLFTMMKTPHNVSVRTSHGNTAAPTLSVLCVIISNKLKG